MSSRARWAKRAGLAALATLAACSAGSIAGDVEPGADGAGTEVVGDSSTTTSADAPSLIEQLDDAPSTTSNDGSNGAVSDGADTTEPQTGTASPAPSCLGTRTLPTTADGFAVAQQTPPELVDRRLITADTISPPTGSSFSFEIAAFDGEPLQRSTWSPGCPVAAEDLRYITVSFWGFDDRPHTGELVIHADEAEEIVDVFATLFELRFPIEEMRIVTSADLEADPTGDSNNTGSFVCRAVTGGSRFSEHAFGLAIDVNPFHNPYVKGDLVLPELASSYLERGTGLPGMIDSGSPVIDAFASIGWEWGGDWNSLKDYQHFSLNNR